MVTIRLFIGPQYDHCKNTMANDVHPDQLDLLGFITPLEVYQCISLVSLTQFFQSLCVFLYLFPLILVVKVCQFFFTFAFVFVFVEEGKVCQQFFRLIRVVTVCRAALRYTQLRRNYHFVTLLFSSRYISIGSTRI